MQLPVPAGFAIPSQMPTPPTPSTYAPMTGTGVQAEKAGPYSYMPSNRIKSIMKEDSDEDFAEEDLDSLEK
eukprot:9939762-Karenia_brevis.AAC.1